MEWGNKTILLVGGTGSFGSAFLPLLLDKKPLAVRIYSRDEHKQSILLAKHKNCVNLSGFIGDIRDKDRLQRAMEGVDIVVHCAALKQVQSCEYNPIETIKTNIIGSMNIIDCALDHNVDKVLAVSTDKAVSPLNLYGATKMCMERLMTTANAYRGSRKRTKFCSTRYGNVVASRGTITPIWRDLVIAGKPIPITNPNATRFWIGMAEANKFVMECIELMDEVDGGEVFVPKMDSVKIMDVYQAMTDGLHQFTVIGDRIGDKLHESLISKEEASHTVDFGDKYIIYPEEPRYFYHKPKGYSCGYADGYTSQNNERFLTVKEIAETLEKNK
jgi:UDP-N-acetylglucosamine 4,6-dehydratase